MKLKLNIVFLDTATLGDVDNLKQIEDIGDYTAFENTRTEERIERIGKNNVVITNKVLIDKDVMDACPDLKLICIAATGMNNIDLAHAEKKGIVVKNVAGYSTESVAQSAFSMLFSLIHQTTYYDNYVKSGEYAKSPIFTHYGPSFWELKGKKFGIIGLGTIGKRVAEIARAFGSEVIYYSTSGKNLESVYNHVELETLLSQSDVVSIHCPLNDKTNNLLDAAKLNLMKPSAYLMNLGRGGIVNEKDLAIAIDERRIAGAAVDVLTKEPVEESSPLLKVKLKNNILITPHIAWASKESRSLLVAKLCENIKRYQKYNS